MKIEQLTRGKIGLQATSIKQKLLEIRGELREIQSALHVVDTYAACMAQLNGTGAVVRLHLQHSDPIVELLGDYGKSSVCSATSNAEGNVLL